MASEWKKEEVELCPKKAEFIICSLQGRGIIARYVLTV